MEEIDEELDTNKCAKCGKEFKSLLAHLKKISPCENFYSPDQLKELREKSAKKTRLKTAQNRKTYQATPRFKELRSVQNKKHYQLHKKEKLQYEKKHYQTNKKQILSKRAEAYKAKTKCLANFYKEIQFGPIFPCICCMRCLPLRSVAKLTDKFYQKLLDNDMAKFVCKEEHLQIFGKWYLCSTCYRNLSNCDMPSQCFENGLKVAAVPDCLKISDVGNQLLAKNLVFIKVRNFNNYFLKLTFKV